MHHLYLKIFEGQLNTVNTQHGVVTESSNDSTGKMEAEGPDAKA